MDTTTGFLIAFALTLAIELPIYLSLVKTRTFDVVTANLWTHPCVYFLVGPLAHAIPYPVAVALLECGAVAFEATYLGRTTRTFQAALAANVASATIGVLLH